MRASPGWPACLSRDGSRRFVSLALTPRVKLAAVTLDRRRNAIWIASALLVACGTSGDGRSGDPAAPAPSAPSASPVAAPAPVLDPNPFKLPASPLRLDKGGRVFTVSDAMLAGAKLGSTLVLQAATVVGLDGELLVIENKSGPSYKVHPAYAIAVPDAAAIRPSDPVITEGAGLMRHAVVKKHVKDRVTVRYTDGDMRIAELVVKSTRFLRQNEGLLPGNFAALGDGETLRHVLLVSTFDDAGEKKWLALGAGGAAMVVPERSLEPIPIKLAVRSGAVVLAEHNGVLRKATVTNASDPGVFTVRYERAGRPVTVGWGSIMPLAQDKPKASPRPSGAGSQPM